MPKNSSDYSRTVNPPSLRNIFAYTNKFIYSYFPHTINQWNNLPSHVSNSISFASYKVALRQYVFTAFKKKYMDAVFELRAHK